MKTGIGMEQSDLAWTLCEYLNRRHEAMEKAAKEVKL